MERLQQELDELKEDYDDLNQRHTGLQENNEELAQKHDALKGGIKKLQSELNVRQAENERLRLRDCQTILEGEEIVVPDEPSFLDEEIEEEPEVEDEPKGLDGDQVEVVEEEQLNGPQQEWGSTRGRFSKGSAMRVENKAFIKN